MECAVESKIKSTVQEIRRISFEEKINSSEEKMNQFLDAILHLKGTLNEKSNTIFHLVELMENVTWLKIEDKNCLMLLNDLIAQAKDLHSSLIRNYVVLNRIKQKGIAKDEIVNYKSAIDDFKDSYTDLESVFFFLPSMPEFKEVTKELSFL